MVKKALIISTGDGECDAFIAYPDENGSFPGVILYMDVFGLRGTIYEMVERVAALGYYVLAPNVFYRQKKSPLIDPTALPSRKDEVYPEVAKLMGAYTPSEAVRDAGAYLKFLSEQKQCTPDKVGCTGYCMGGVLSFRTAVAYPDRIVAAASFHAGRMVTDAVDSPHRLVGKMNAEVYVAHADHDSSMTPAQISELEGALDSGRVKFKGELYKDAPHGFTMRDLPAFRKEADDRHWAALAELLGRTLG